MRIIDQNISLYAHNQSFLRNQKSEQLEEFVGGRLVNQQTKTTDSQSMQSATYSQNAMRSDRHNSVEDNGDPSKSHPNGKMIAERDGNNTRLGSLVNNERANDPFANALFQDRVTLSSQNGQGVNLSGNQQLDRNGIQLPAKLVEMIETIESMLEKMTGQKTTLQVYGYNTPENPATENVSKGAEGFVHPFSPQGMNQRFTQAFDQAFALNFAQAFQQPLDPRVTPEQMSLEGRRVTFSQSHQESETTSFRAAGNVTTADGKSINFELQTQMSREFYSASEVQIEEGFILKDPLVVNFGGQPASLSIDKVKFDLDSDGDLENMAFLNAGSGFLFLDKNQDGQVNNGNELFGTQSGDGFADLRQYDEDQNGWIDENDSIFSQLQIWHKNAQGLDEMTGLLNLNIGAIYLESVESPFTVKDHNNQTQGQVVSSGVYLSEDGKAGSIQQIDLAV